MNLKMARQQVAALHPRLKLVNAYSWNEYQVRVQGAVGSTYFTNDLQDAVDTAARMAQQLRDMEEARV